MEEETDIIYEYDDEDTSTVADKHVWSKDMTFCLIKEYRNHLQDFLYPQGRMIRDIWETISLNMHAKGFAVSAGSCDQKWRQLKKTFKYNKPKTCRRSRTKWIYYKALEDILNNKEITERISWKQRSTIKQEPNSPSDCIQSESFDENIHPCSNGKVHGINSPTTSEKEKPPRWFQQFLHQFHKDREDKRNLLNKMHSQLKEVEQEKCNILKTIISKFPKPEPIPKIVSAVSLSQEEFENDERLRNSFL